MTELTFAQRWSDAKLPKKDILVSAADFHDLVNVQVNGLLLPSTLNAWDAVTTDDLIHLPKENMDWFPFFSGVDMANTLFNDLAGQVGVYVDPEGGFDDFGSVSYGFLFSPVANVIYAYAATGMTRGYSMCAPLGDFNATTRKLHEGIGKLNKRNFHKIPIENKTVLIPDKPMGYTRSEGSWTVQGREPTSTLYAYCQAKLMFERLYGHPLSEVPSCHLS